MGTLTLGANAIKNTNIVIPGPGTPANVDFYLYGHLQILFNTGGSTLEIEVQAPRGEGEFDPGLGDQIFLKLGNFIYPVIANAAPRTDFFRGSSEEWGEVSISLIEDRQTRTDDATWALLRQIHDNFSSKGRGIEYGLNQNSNSYATTLLWMVGGIASTAAVKPSEVGSFPGAGRNLANGPIAIDFNLNGTASDDYLRTGIGDDRVSGIAGNDWFSTGTGEDTVLGGAGDDTLDSGGGDDTVEGGTGDDSIDAGSGDDSVLGQDGADTVMGGVGRDTIDGGEGNDSLDGGTASDSIEGGAGADTLMGQSGDDDLSGGAGDDTLDGGSGLDSLKGGAGNDLLIGGEGSDDLDGGAGNDTMRGGEGYDVYLADGGDTISDSDGEGSVRFNGLTLTGGTKEPEDPEEDCEREGDERSDGRQTESDDEEPYVGSAGEEYRWAGGGLEVTYNGATITISGWSDGDLGITLEEGDVENNQPECFASPIVLDLDGDGVEIVELAASVAFFDIDADGIAERTAWVAPDDGLLALDVNGDGAISGADELFGYRDGDTLSGFDRLAAFDADLSGSVDAADARFGELLVWRDLNGDGRSSVGEVTGLTEAGVASIRVEAARVDETLADSRVSDRGTFETIGGATRDALDVWFRFNQFDTRLDDAGALDPAVEGLPDIRGTGRVLDLHVAMSRDADLRAQVEALTSLTASDLGSVQSRVTEILFRWTGTENVGAYGRGGNVDGRMLAAIEAFGDDPFRQRGTEANPRPNAGGELMVQFDEIHRDLTAKMLAQMQLGTALFPELRYEGNAFLLLDEGTDSASVLQRLEDTAPLDPLDAVAHWLTGVRLLDTVHRSFADVEAAGDGGAAYRADAVARLAALGVVGDYDTLILAHAGGDGTETFITSSAFGGLRADPSEVVLTGAGNDRVSLSGGDNQMLWGAGQGNDTVSFKSFAANEIRLVGLTSEDVTISIDVQSLRSVDVTVTIDATGETLVMRGAGTIDPQRGIVSTKAELFGEAGQNLGLRDLLIAELARLTIPTDGDDTLVQGLSPVLDGGAGNDLLIGATNRATEYVWGVGDGNDTIRDRGDADAQNTLSFAGPIDPEDLDFSLGANGSLVLTLTATGETITIENAFLGATSVISSFSFGSGRVLSAQDALLRAAVASQPDRINVFGTSSADSLVGTDADEIISAGRGDDTVEGGGGDDFLSGGQGSDLLRGGDGDDALEGTFRGELGGGFIGPELERPQTLDGGAGDDTLIGNQGDDLVIGGDGADLLAGDRGADVYDPGAGNDTIYDDDGDAAIDWASGDGDDLVVFGFGSVGDTATVTFGPGIEAKDLSFSAVQVDLSDLADEAFPFRTNFRGEVASLADYIGLPTFLGSDWAFVASVAGGGSLTIRDINGALGERVSLAFDDGSTLNSAAIRERLVTGSDAADVLIADGSAGVAVDGGAGDDTIIVTGFGVNVRLAPGGGEDRIVGESISEVRLAPGVTFADVTARREGDDLVLSLADGAALRFVDSFRLRVEVDDRFFGGVFPESGPTFSRLVQENDGASLFRTAFLQQRTNGDDVSIGSFSFDGSGSPGDDTVVGTDEKDVYGFEALGGSTRIEERSAPFAFAVEGSISNEFEALEAQPLNLGELRSLSDEVIFADGIDLADLSLSFEGAGNSDLVITHGPSGTTMTLIDQMAPAPSYGFTTQTRITDQSTGEVVDIPGLGSDRALTAESWGFLEANYQIWLDNNDGGGDGYGEDVFEVFDIGGPGGSGGEWGSDPLFSAGIEIFTLADGTTYDRTGFVQALLDAQTATDGADLLLSGPSGAILDGGLGDDTLRGGSGDDTYILGEAYGDDVVTDGGGQDRLAIVDTIELRALQFERDGDDLLILIGGPARSAIRIEGQFAPGAAAIETITLPDGQTLSAEDVRRLLIDQASTPGDDIIETFRGDDLVRADTGDDVIRLEGGNDTVDGEAGRDTAVFAGSSDRYEIVRDGEETLVVDLSGTGHVTTLRSVEVIAFADAPEATVEIVKNAAPVAQNTVRAGTEDTVLRLTAGDLSALGTDADGETLKLVSVGAATGGTVKLDADGFVTFTPDADQTGEAGFDYTLADGAGAESTARVTVQLAAVNDAPTVAVASVNVSSPEDLALDLALPAGTFADVDGDTLIVTATRADGTDLPDWLSFDGSRFTGQPPQDFNGRLDLTVVATDGAASVETAFALTIDPVNDAPTLVAALPDVTAQDGVVAVLLPPGAFADVDGDALTLTGRLTDGGPLPDWLSLQPSSGVLFGRVPSDLSGTLEVEITASDGSLSVSDTITVTLPASNRAPVLTGPPPAQLDAVEDTVFDIALDTGLFLDPDGDALTLSATQVDGTDLPAWLSFDGTRFAGQAPEDFAGSVALTVTASDGALSVAFDTALVVAPVNDAPVAADDVGPVVTAGRSVTLATADLLENDRDPDGDTLEIVSVSAVSGGTVALTQDGVVFTADAEANGAARFTYTVSDGTLTGTADVELTVEPDDPPSDPYADYRRGTEGNDTLWGRLFSQNAIFGAGGNDVIGGGLRADRLAGGDGRDWLIGSLGNDLLEGNAGDDKLWGGVGDDTFVFRSGDGVDWVQDFSASSSLFGGDRLALDLTSVETAGDALDLARQDGHDVVFDFGEGDVLVLRRTSLSDLDAGMIDIL